MIRQLINNISRFNNMLKRKFTHYQAGGNPLFVIVSAKIVFERCHKNIVRKLTEFSVFPLKE